MSTFAVLPSEQILGESFGDVTVKIASYLLRNSAAVIQIICDKTGIKRGLVICVCLIFID